MDFRIPETINLEIVTPERLLFSGEVEAVTVPALEGYLGILPGHAPLLSELDIGVISYRAGGRDVHLFCGWGFVEVLADRVSVLAEVAESADRIDAEQARADQAEAEQILGTEDEETDYPEVLTRWRQAVARLETLARSD